jgi:hypothetical protein
MIEKTSFGSITVEGATYTSDLLLFPDGRVADAWRRSSGHRLHMEDIEILVAAAPEVIVAGCGVFGRMKPEPGLAPALAEKGIEFHAASNAKAVKIYNEQAAKHKTGACFHLTC